MVSIKNRNVRPLSSFLDDNEPYSQGIEPGTVAYVKKSDVRFLRNSCIDGFNTNYIPNKIIYLNPRYDFSNMLQHLDVLLCKDANIGESCLFVNEDSSVYTHSSGVVKFNFKSDEFKYYCLAFLKDDYFLQQLDSKTPRGSTIRHAGDKFLDCLIPLPSKHADWLYSAFEHLTKNIAYSEYSCYKKIMRSVDIIDRELMVKQVNYQYPLINQIAREKRVDAGIYSEDVYSLFENIKGYKHGNSTLDQFGFCLKRGPNLARRDLGRSIQTTAFKKNFNVLIYPSDISDGGYLLRSSYIGARNPIWFLESKNILFGAEGTVGKTFVVCDEDLRFTTNFHGTIIYPINASVPLSKSIFLGLFLNYLRIKGIFSKLAVGGQGGSFALGYWDIISIPNFPSDAISALSSLYHQPFSLNPLEFDTTKIEAAGVFELNNFRILCKSLLELICADIKSDLLNSTEHYEHYLTQI